MDEASYYTEMAQLAMAQGLPGEAQSIIEKGMTNGVLDKAQREKEHGGRILKDAKQAVTLDKSTLEKQDALARSKPTGDADTKLGSAYLSYGLNDKAVEALQRGIGKGGVKNPDEAGTPAGHRLPAHEQQGRSDQGVSEREAEPDHGAYRQVVDVAHGAPGGGLRIRRAASRNDLRGAAPNQARCRNVQVGILRNLGAYTWQFEAG